MINLHLYQTLIACRLYLLRTKSMLPAGAATLTAKLPSRDDADKMIEALDEELRALESEL
jgi:hypothetical protein